MVSASIPFLSKLSPSAMAFEVMVCVRRRTDNVDTTDGRAVLLQLRIKVRLEVKLPYSREAEGEPF